MIENLLFLVMTTNPKLWNRKKPSSDHFLGEEALLEEQLVIKIGKAEEEVIRKKVTRKILSSDTKASSGRTDAKVQICGQRQASCRLEIGMDDCVAAVTAAVAVYRRRKQRIVNINHLALVLEVARRGRCNRVPRTYICSLCHVRRTAVTFSLQVRCCWRPLAQYRLHGTLRSSSCIRVVVQVRNDRRPRAVPRHGC